MDEERRTVEAWAQAKGHAPKTRDAWMFSAAQAGENWPAGKELTEADYDAAIHRACNVQMGYSSGR